MVLLEQWLKPLREQHLRAKEEETARSRDRQEQAEREEKERREREKNEKKLKEMADFKPMPLVVIYDYENDNVKLLRHAVRLPSVRLVLFLI
jgi:hypothetical protein